MKEKDSGNFFGLIVFLGLLLAFMLYLFFFISDNTGFLHNIAKTYGPLGIFFGAIISNATVLLPIPFDALVFFLGANPALAGFGSFNIIAVVLTGLLGGIGAGIGEMTAYITGLSGVKALEKIKNKEFVRLEEIRSYIRRQGMWFVFFCSVIPFPFDIIGLTAGIIKYDFYRFFIAAAAGKGIRYMVVFTAGHFGFEIVRSFFTIV